MIYKPFALLLMLALFTGVNTVSAEDEGPCEKLELIEEAIRAADLATAACQMTTGWHFPLSFYNHIQKAQDYCTFRKNGKMSKKTMNSLNGLLEAIQESIDGIDGYWTADLPGLWIDPVPSAPECAIPVLEELKNVVESLLPLSG